MVGCGSHWAGHDGLLCQSGSPGAYPFCEWGSDCGRTVRYRIPSAVADGNSGTKLHPDLDRDGDP